MMTPIWNTITNPQKRFFFSKADAYIAEEREARDRGVADKIEKAICQAMRENESEVVLFFNQNIPTEVYDYREALRLVVESLYDSGFKVSLKEHSTFIDARGASHLADYVLAIGWDWKKEEEDNG